MSRSAGDPDPAERSFRFLGLTVIRKTDLLAAAAFFISVSTVIIQLYGFARGARLAMFAPDTVYVRFDPYADRSIVTRVAAQVTVTNSGDAGASAVLRDVSATISVGDLHFTEPWFSFADISRQGIRFIAKPTGPAHPFVIAGGGAESVLVYFAPAIRSCTGQSGCDEHGDYVSDQKFLQVLDKAGIFTVALSARSVGSDHLLGATCSVKLSREAFDTLAENGWYAARCIGNSR